MKYLKFESCIVDVGGRNMFCVTKVCLTATLNDKAGFFMVAKIGEKTLLPQFFCYLVSPVLLLKPNEEKRVQQYANI